MDLMERINRGMPQGIQTDFTHYPELRTFGCFFFTLLKLVEIKTGITFSNEEIVSIFERCKAAGFITNNSFIQSSVKVFNKAAGNWLVDDFIRHTPDTGIPTDEVYIIDMRKSANVPQHFVLASGGKIIWDSWRPAAGDTEFSVNNYRTMVLHG
jgi:hypothetical protein